MLAHLPTRSPFASPWGLVPVLVVAVWLRAPYIDAGIPFIHGEDEAHHFQRVVQMVKDGRFDPNYFNKPSLHLYLRMPVVAAAFVSAVKAGEVRRIEELVTRADPPRGGWASTVSHPRILRWNRAFGVALGVLAVGLTWALASAVGCGPLFALFAALVAALSPALASDAAKVGVDTPLVVMCLLAMLLAIRLHERFTMGRLVAAGLLAGLAFSTKYNALPIVVLPAAVSLMARRRDAVTLMVALATPVAGFLLGTPYALLDLPEFLNDMAFESWHYGTAGHGAATGEPGLSQAWFYLRWFSSQAGVGLGVVLLSGAGVARLARGREARAAVFLLFPVLFFVLMANQKVNFTRNVLVLLPTLAVLAAVGLEWLAVSARLRRAPRLIALALAAVVLAQPGVAAIEARSRVMSAPPDSRTLAARWLTSVSTSSEVAVASELDFPRLPRVTPIETARLDPVALYLDGFERVVAGSSFAPDTSTGTLREEQKFDGRPDDERVIVSPRVTIYRVNRPADALLQAGLRSPEGTIAPEVRYKDSTPTRADEAGRCGAERALDAEGPGGQSACWAAGRLTRLVFDGPRAAQVAGRRTGVTLQADLRSPWSGQRCTLNGVGWQSPDLCAGHPAASWFPVEVELPVAAARAGALVLEVSEVRALPIVRSGRQPARAGLAIGRLVFR